MTFSVLQKSQLEGAQRLDAEYYSVPTIFKNYLLGGEIANFIQYGTSRELNEERRGYPTLRLNEFEDFFIQEPTKYCDKISEKTFEDLKLKSGDVLICRTNGNPGLVGKSAIVMDDHNFVFASYLFRVRAKNNLINSHSLATFLNSKFGRSEIEKHMMISNQTNFSPAKFKLIKVPKFPKSFQMLIKKLLEESQKQLLSARKFYSQAEGLVLEELGLKDFQIPEDLTYVVNYSDTEKVERVDADYFQPKYDKLISKIKTQNAKKLLEVIENVPSIFTPVDDQDYKYVELANINSSIGIIDGFSEFMGKEAPSRARRLLRNGDVIVSSIQGSLEKVALVGKEQDGNLASTGFFQFTSNEILPEVLLVMAKSIVLQWQLERECAGTILSAVPQESLKRLVVPILPTKVQQKIADLVKKSHEARKKSKQLLEETKRKVEEMIEKGGDN